MYGGYGNKRRNTGGIMSYGREVDAGWQQSTYILGAALLVFLLGYFYLYFVISGLNLKLNQSDELSNARQAEVQQLQGKVRSSEYVADRRQQNYEKQLGESRELRSQLRQKTLDYLELEKKHQSVSSEVTTVTALLQEEKDKRKLDASRATDLQQQVKDLSNSLYEARRQKDEASRQLELEISLSQQREKTARELELKLRDDLLRCQAASGIPSQDKSGLGSQPPNSGEGVLPPGVGTDSQQGVKLQQTNKGQPAQQIRVGTEQQDVQQVGTSNDAQESVFTNVVTNNPTGVASGDATGDTGSRSRKDLE